MAKLTPIRLTQNDRKEYARLVKNTKSKIRRVQKKYGIDLTDSIDIPALEDIRTRKQFNEVTQNFSSFTNRNNLNYQFKQNEYGVTATKARLQRIDRKVKQAQNVAKEHNKMYQDKAFYSGGKKQGTIGAQQYLMKRPEGVISVPDDFNFDTVISEQRLKKIEEIADKKGDWNYYSWRKEVMKNNYINALSESFNSNADSLIDLIQGIPADDFYEIYLANQEFDFEVFYSIEGVEGRDDSEVVKKLKMLLDDYYNGDTNMDLKKFNRNG